MKSASESHRSSHTPNRRGTSMAGQRMRAIVQKEYGTADVLHVAEIDRPVIEADEVLVQVRAAGLDRGTWHLMAGLPYAARLVVGLRAPKNAVPGLDVAGVVVAVGSQVTRFQPGDEVFGISKGSFAEFAAAREDKLARKPSTLSFEQAAAVPVSGMTALRGLCDVGRLRGGAEGSDRRRLGRRRHATPCRSPRRSERKSPVSAARANSTWCARSAPTTSSTTARRTSPTGEKRYDLILDIGGNSALSRLRRALTPKGTLVIAGGEDGGRWIGMDRQLRALALSPFVGQRLTTFGPKEHYTVLERLIELIENGQLVPVIEQTYPLSDMPNAMRHLGSRPRTRQARHRRQPSATNNLWDPRLNVATGGTERRLTRSRVVSRVGSA